MYIRYYRIGYCWIRHPRIKHQLKVSFSVRLQEKQKLVTETLRFMLYNVVRVAGFSQTWQWSRPCWPRPPGWSHPPPPRGTDHAPGSRCQGGGEPVHQPNWLPAQALQPSLKKCRHEMNFEWKVEPVEDALVSMSSIMFSPLKSSWRPRCCFKHRYINIKKCKKGSLTSWLI